MAETVWCETRDRGHRSCESATADESLSLIHILRAHDQPQFRRGGLNAISSDQTISEAVRQRAFQFAREWKP